MDIKLKIGQRIKESRKNKGLTAVQLAEKTGFSAQRISNWERGSRTPKFKDAEILGDALGVKTTWLLFLDIDQPIGKHNFHTINIINSLSKIAGLLPVPSIANNNLNNNLSSAFIISDNSMSPAYKPGDIIVFCENKQKNNDLVLIKIKASGECLFRKIKHDDNAFVFYPLNPDWPQICFESESVFQVIGWAADRIKVFF